MSDNWAIVIGIDEYRVAAARLAGAVGDALRMAEWLLAPGGGAVPPRQLVMLLSARPGHDIAASLAADSPVRACLPALEATQENVFAAIQRVLDRSGRAGDRLFFHFSGHGISSASQNGMAFADFTSLLTQRSLTVGSLAELFQATRIREQFFFIDGCRNAPFGRLRQLGTWPNGDDLVPVPPVSPQYGMYATAPMETAQQVDERGAFTDALLEGLAGRGSAKLWDANLGEDGGYLVRWSSLLRYVSRAVQKRRLATGADTIQAPRRFGEAGDDDPVLAQFPAADFASGETLRITVSPPDALSKTRIVVKDLADLIRTQSPPIERLPVEFTLPPRQYRIDVAALGWMRKPGGLRELPIYEPTDLTIELQQTLMRARMPLRDQLNDDPAGAAHAPAEPDPFDGSAGPGDALRAEIHPPQSPLSGGSGPWSRDSASVGRRVVPNPDLSLPVAQMRGLLLYSALGRLVARGLGRAVLAGLVRLAGLRQFGEKEDPPQRLLRGLIDKNFDAQRLTKNVLPLGKIFERDELNRILGGGGSPGPSDAAPAPPPVAEPGLHVEMPDQLARVEIRDQAGHIAAFGRGPVSLVPCPPGFYVARLALPENDIERAIAVPDEGAALPIDLTEQSMPSGGTLITLLDRMLVPRTRDGAVTIFEGAGAIAAARLTSFLALAGAVAAREEAGSVVGQVRDHLGFDSRYGTADVLVLAGSDVEDGWTESLRLSLMQGGAPEASTLPPTLTPALFAANPPPDLVGDIAMTTRAAGAVAFTCAHGQQRLRIAEPDGAALALPLTVLPGHATLIVLTRDAEQRIALTSFLLARDRAAIEAAQFVSLARDTPVPELDRGLMSVRRLDLMQRAAASGRAWLAREEIDAVLTLRWRDPMAATLGAFLALRQDTAPPLGPVAAWLAETHPGLPDAHVLRGIAAEADGDTERAAACYRAALDIGTPMLRDATSRLVTGAGRLAPEHPALPALRDHVSRTPAHIVLSAIAEFS